MKYVQPLYKALGNHADTRKLAREIFAETRDRVHTLTRQVAEAAMKAYPAD
ncbi:MAG: leukotriene A4 hydrolase C-terminal domain-containing protein [Acidobacteriota bacterium]